MTNDSCLSCGHLQNRIKELEEEIKLLKDLKPDIKIEKPRTTTSEQQLFVKCKLHNKDIERYSRQLILPEVAVKGQYSLLESSVLVVGAGGLGCPAAMYLAAAGVGHIGLVDYDVVDLSNLHRQILHSEDTIGMKKVDSIAEKLRRLNSAIQLSLHYIALSSANAPEIIKKYDFVLDCTDNVATRYLLNDACVMEKKPLISGSALRFEGQLTVYNYLNGPCYRCLYPLPPPPEAVTNCSDGGVIGTITGVIGSLQALETIKIITGNHPSYSGKLLLFDGLNGTFRNIQIRGKKDSCAVCGSTPSITSLKDYELFCGAKASDKERMIEILKKEQRLTVQEYREILTFSESQHLLIDVRPKVEFEICSLKNSKNIPITEITSPENLKFIDNAVKHDQQVIIVCKRGNDSQVAVSKIIDYLKKHGLTDKSKVKDVIGGLTAWNVCIDNRFPIY